MNGELFDVRTSQIESSMLEARVHDLTIIIMNYCGAESSGGQQGNHKTALINDPLTKGYTLAVRYKQAYEALRRGECQEAGNYDCAWNKPRLDGSIRDIFQRFSGSNVDSVRQG